MSPRRTPAPTRLRLEVLEDRTLLATCHVTRLSDTGVGQGLRGDLRYCINYANNNPGPDAIDFKVTGTINLTGALPDLATDIDILGPGANLLTVARSNSSGFYRIFNVTAGGTVALSGLTIANGQTADGAGIYNAGSLAVNSCT